MITAQQKVPTLRFKDKQGKDYPDWGKKRLEEVSTKVNDSYNPNTSDHAFDCVELESLEQGNGQILQIFNSKDKKSIKTKFKAGDVLFGKLRPYLRKCALIKFDGVCTSEIWVFRAKNVSSLFLFTLIQSDKFFRVANIQSGSKIPRADWGLVSDTKFSIPRSIEEEQKIAAFLSAVDTKIEQLNRKKSLLAQYKQGMMQKLFSQEIRFKNEQGEDYSEWEKQCMGNIATIIMGTSPRSSAYNQNSEGLPLIQGNADVKNRKSAPRMYTSEITKECLPNDTLISVRAPVGDISKAVHRACLGRGMAVIRASSDVSQAFLYNYLILYESKWRRVSQGSTFESVNSNDVRAVSIYVPSMIEQQKIAAFLSAIDRKIGLVAEQLNQARTFKKGLLQQMFI